MRQVADQLGGSVTAETAAGGGTLMRLHLPGAETIAAADEPRAAARSPEAGLALADRHRTTV